ncbi:MAG: hypothetical protein KDJ54_01570 [Candidatus Competibacteraceae bacterium]|nr:hypothetical protein [Candidatus Competibacteraceae bacterium]
MSRSKLGGLLLALLLIGWFAPSGFAQETPTAPDDGWLTRAASGEPRVHL